jgi:hypothetical protein
LISAVSKGYRDESSSKNSQMKRRNISHNSGKPQVKRERDPLPWRYCLLTLVCGLILVGGFFYAARQHFSAIDYSIKNAKLRQLKENLQSEQRQLYLAREIAIAPIQIKKAAKKIGLQDFTTNSIEYVNRKIASVNPLAEKDAKEKTKPPSASALPKAAEAKEDKAKPVKAVKENKENKLKVQSSTSGDLRERLARK